MNKNNIFWGIGLIILGVIFLGANYDWFDISFKKLAQFWPLFLIFAGINLIISKTTGSTPSGLTALFIIFAIPLSIIDFSKEKINRFEDKFEKSFDDFEDESDDDQAETSRNADRKYDDESGTSTPAIVDGSTQTFTADDYTSQKEAELEFVLGGAKVEIKDESKAIFKGLVDINDRSSFKLQTTEEGGISKIGFKMKGKVNHNDNFEINSDNKVTLGLNKNPIWNLDFVFGAGQLIADLSDYRTKNIKLKAGAGDIELKLGDKLNDQKVDIETGASSLKIKIPKSVGCIIENDGVLNSKDFNGFTKDGDNYKTENYDGASKKIKIKIESAVASIKVDRY